MTLTTTASASEVTSFGPSAQSVSLTATVQSLGVGVNEGSATFTILDAQGHTIGTPISGTVSNGTANVSYTLPANTPVGVDTIQASYRDSSGVYNSSADSSQTLTVTPDVYPTLTSVPINGMSTVTIVGAGFDTNPANDSVTFSSGATGTVTAVTGGGTSLTVTIATLPGSLGVLTAVVTTDGISSGTVQVATVTPAASPTGNTIITAYGSGSSGQLWSPNTMAVDATGNLFIADSWNNRIVEVIKATGQAITIATGFNDPSGIAVDAAGNIYIADTYHNTIVKLTPAGNNTYTSIIIGGIFGIAGNSNGDLAYPSGVAVDGNGDVFVADTFND